MRDVENQYTHKVAVKQMEAYNDNEVDVVTSFCGKIWAPTDNRSRLDSRLGMKPNCPQCFRAITPFAIAA